MNAPTSRMDVRTGGFAGGQARNQGVAPRPTPHWPLPGGGLVGANSPAFRLPVQHFLAGLAFLLAGAFGLVVVAPDLSAGSFSHPRVVAVAHLFTLGWITTSIQGALYQFLPVALGQPIRWRRLADVSFALYTPGLALFIASLAVGSHTPMLVGVGLFASGLLVFLANLAATLKRCRERNLTWWALVGASVFLLATTVLGASLAGNLRWGYLGSERFLAIGVHLHVAVAGWVMLVVIGVAHRLLPMFLLSHGASERPGRLALGLTAGGTASLLAFHHWLVPVVKWSIAAMLAAGLVAFVVQARLFFRHRKRPVIDPGLRLAALAMGGFALALGVAPLVVAWGVSAPRLATGYVILLIVAGLSLFVAGHFYKILPFLIWFHRFGPLVGRAEVPRVLDLYSARVAGVVAGLLASGAFGLAGATLIGSPGLTRLAAIAFAAGAAGFATQMFVLVTKRPHER